MNIQVNDKFRNKKGLTGTVKNFCGVKRLEVRDKLGKVTQTISLRKIDFSIFEKVTNNEK